MASSPLTFCTRSLFTIYPRFAPSAVFGAYDSVYKAPLRLFLPTSLITDIHPLRKCRPLFTNVCTLSLLSPVVIPNAGLQPKDLHCLPQNSCYVSFTSGPSCTARHCIAAATVRSSHLMRPLARPKRVVTALPASACLLACYCLPVACTSPTSLELLSPFHFLTSPIVCL